MSAVESKAGRCFIDTNIWLYTFIVGQDQGKSTRAKEVVQSVDAVISTQVINEVCVNLIKKAWFSEDKVRQLIQSFYHRCQVTEYTQKIFDQASVLRERYLFSYWDSTIVASALNAAVPVLYSEDMQNGLIVQDTLQIINPFSTS